MVAIRGPRRAARRAPSRSNNSNNSNNSSSNNKHNDNNDSQTNMITNGSDSRSTPSGAKSALACAGTMNINICMFNRRIMCILKCVYVHMNN